MNLRFQKKKKKKKKKKILLQHYTLRENKTATLWKYISIYSKLNIHAI